MDEDTRILEGIGALLKDELETKQRVRVQLQKKSTVVRQSSARARMRQGFPYGTNQGRDNEVPYGFLEA
jgi:hypothetical protein